MKPFLLFVLLAAAQAGFTDIAAQDIHFSQMFETPLLRNPALAGIFSGDIRAQSVYRSQYNSVANAYRTASANVEYKMLVGKTDDFVTMGAQVLYDKAGTVALTSTHFLPALNYHKSMGAERNMYLSLGATAGLVQRSIDKSKITTNSQFNGSIYNPNADNGESFSASSYSYFDASVGMSFNAGLGSEQDNNLYIGLACHHFNKAKKINFYSTGNMEMTPKWVASGGIKLSTSNYNYITIEADYSKQASYTEIIGGVLYSIKLDSPDEPKYLVHVGAYLRVNDAIIPVLKLEAKPLSFAVSYDVNISGLKSVSYGQGGFEVSVAFQKFLDRETSARDAVRCPRF